MSALASARPSVDMSGPVLVDGDTVVLSVKKSGQSKLVSALYLLGLASRLPHSPLHTGLAALTRQFEAANRPAPKAVLDKLAALRSDLAKANKAVEAGDYKAHRRARKLAAEISRPIQATAWIGADRVGNKLLLSQIGSVTIATR